VLASSDYQLDKVQFLEHSLRRADNLTHLYLYLLIKNSYIQIAYIYIRIRLEAIGIFIDTGKYRWKDAIADIDMDKREYQ